MTGKPGRGRSLQRRGAWTPALVVLALAACDGAGLGGRTAGSTDAAEDPGGSPDEGTRTTLLAETDVEAPEVFQVTEDGLWDGRPSLGGVWVAHPDVAEPERVVIRNQDNGQFVIGALFRRERDNPGPALQVSSDAAEALGMLAGAPAPLDVTALRRGDAAEPASTPAPTEAGDPEGVPVEGAGAPAADDAGGAPGEVAPASPDPSAAGAVARATSAILDGDPPPSTEPSAPADAASAKPAASDLGRSFIQLGPVGLSGDAQAVAAEGLPAQAMAFAAQGASAVRVPVDPPVAEAEHMAFQDRVAGDGFPDTSFVAS